MKIAMSLDKVVTRIKHENRSSSESSFVKWIGARPTSGALDAIRALRKRHDLAIVTPYPYYRATRDWLKKHDLQWMPAYVGIGHVAGFCRDNGYEILITGHKPYAKGADTVGLFTILFQPSALDKWGVLVPKRFGVADWVGAEHYVKLIAGDVVDPWPDKLKRILKKFEEIDEILAEE